MASIQGAFLIQKFTSPQRLSGKGETTMGDFTPIESQEALDGIIGERLKRDREAQAKKYEGYVKPEDYAAKCQEYDTTIAGLQKTIEDGKAAASELESPKAQIKK